MPVSNNIPECEDAWVAVAVVQDKRDGAPMRSTTPGWLGVGSARGFAGKELAKERPFVERRDWSGGPLPPRLRVCARHRLAAGPRERKRLLVPGPQALLWLARDEQDGCRPGLDLEQDAQQRATAVGASNSFEAERFGSAGGAANGLR